MLYPRRIGALSLLVFLEHRHFTPVPVPREDFQLLDIHWEGMRLALVIIPADKRSLADALIAELGLLAADGVPHVIDSAGAKHFPVDLPNLFTLENIDGHFVYRNDPTLNKTADDFEQEAVDAAIAASVEKLQQYNQEIRQ